MNRRKFLQLAMGAAAGVVVGKGTVREPQAAPVVAPLSEGIHTIQMTWERPSHTHSYDTSAWLDVPDWDIRHIQHAHSLAKKGA